MHDAVRRSWLKEFKFTRVGDNPILRKKLTLAGIKRAYPRIQAAYDTAYEASMEGLVPDEELTSGQLTARQVKEAVVKYYNSVVLEGVTAHRLAARPIAAVNPPVLRNGPRASQRRRGQNQEVRSPF